MDGSSKQAVIRITTATFDDPCGYENPTILKARTNSTDLSYDYIMVKGSLQQFRTCHHRYGRRIAVGGHGRHLGR